VKLLIETESSLRDYALKELEMILNKKGEKDWFNESLIVYDTKSITDDLMMITLFSETVYSFYLEVGRFEVNVPDDMYRKALEVNWHEFWDPELTFAVRPVIRDQRISREIGVKVGQAIVDKFLTELGKRPRVNLSNPDIEIMAWLKENRLLLAINLCGENLNNPEAVFARSLLIISEWNYSKSMAEIFCDHVAISARRLAIRDPYREKVARRIFIKTKFIDKERVLYLMRKNWRKYVENLRISCYERINRIDIVKQEKPEIRNVALKNIEQLNVGSEEYILSNMLFVIEKKIEERKWLEKVFKILEQNRSWEKICLFMMSDAYPGKLIGEKVFEKNIKFKGMSCKIVCLYNK